MQFQPSESSTWVRRIEFDCVNLNAISSLEKNPQGAPRLVGALEIFSGKAVVLF
jgi:hypothetical protein